MPPEKQSRASPLRHHTGENAFKFKITFTICSGIIFSTFTTQPSSDVIRNHFARQTMPRSRYRGTSDQAPASITTAFQHQRSAGVSSPHPIAFRRHRIARNSCERSGAPPAGSVQGLLRSGSVSPTPGYDLTLTDRRTGMAGAFDIIAGPDQLLTERPQLTVRYTDSAVTGIVTAVT